MFETSIGPVKDAGSTVYLRPETAQGIFLAFKTTLQYARKRPPFGIAQIGKSFRNEITPGNFIFRTLEFQQMEMEFFVPPDEAARWHEHWMQARMDWYVRLGIDREALRLREHGPDELSHYSSATSDIEYLYPIGWSELEGIANRGDFDLTQHAEFSGQKLEYVDTASGERYVPHVIEPAAGVGRTVLALLCDAYDEDEIGGEQRTVLRLAPHMAPIKVAVLPLVNKDGQPEKARAIYEELRGHFPTEYDTGGSIGKRYRRQDEIGTPWGVTVDHQTMEDDTVTLRDRDTLEQERIAGERARSRDRAPARGALSGPRSAGCGSTRSTRFGSCQSVHSPLHRHRRIPRDAHRDCDEGHSPDAARRGAGASACRRRRPRTRSCWGMARAAAGGARPGGGDRAGGDAEGFSVALVEQPYRVAGGAPRLRRTSSTPPGWRWSAS